IRMVEPRVQAFTAFFPLREVLEQQAAGKPVFAPPLGCQPNQARNLLRLREIALCRLRQVPTFEWHDPLMAFFRDWLIEGNRKIPLAKQLLEVWVLRGFGEALAVVADVAAKL